MRPQGRVAHAMETRARVFLPDGPCAFFLLRLDLRLDDAEGAPSGGLAGPAGGLGLGRGLVSDRKTNTEGIMPEEAGFLDIPWAGHSRKSFALPAPR